MKKEMTMITVKLSKELVEKAKQKAAEEETTVSAIIRKLLLDYTRAS
jgi:predicted DNA binding CopG/RHH family protein